jgi:hypothetical protein
MRSGRPKAENCLLACESAEAVSRIEPWWARNRRLAARQEQPAVAASQCCSEDVPSRVGRSDSDNRPTADGVEPSEPRQTVWAPSANMKQRNHFGGVQSRCSAGQFRAHVAQPEVAPRFRFV